MGIFRKSRSTENWGLPQGMDLASAAATVVREMQVREAAVRHPAGVALEYIEVVEVDLESDLASDSREPGILMSWHQGPQRFGLVASISSLLATSGNLERLVADLERTIDTPHSGSATVRTWYAALPLPAGA